MNLKKIFCSLSLMPMVSLPAYAMAADAPFTATKYRVEFSKTQPLTADVAKAVQQEITKNNFDIEKLVFTFNKLTNADGLKVFVNAFPNAQNICIRYSEELTDIAPLAGLKSLKSADIDAENLKDVSPLADLTTLSSISLDYNATGQDLAWMSNLSNLKNIDLDATGLSSVAGLPSLPKVTRISLNGIDVPNLDTLVTALPDLSIVDLQSSKIADLTALGSLSKLRDLDLYGANVKDFSPLAKAQNLQKVMYYAVKDADFSTLGTLKQVNDLHGGLTKMDSIAWMTNMPKLERFTLFGEDVTDYTPLAGAPNLEYLKIWSMDQPVGDLAFLKSVPKLTELIITGNKGVTNFAAIGNLTGLKNLNLEGEFKGDNTVAIPLAFLDNLTALDKLDIADLYVKDFDVSKLTALKYITLERVNAGEGQEGIDLSSLNNLQALQSINIQKTPITKIDLKALGALPKLRSITVPKGIFTKEELAVFPKGVRVSER